MYKQIPSKKISLPFVRLLPQFSLNSKILHSLFSLLAWGGGREGKKVEINRFFCLVLGRVASTFSFRFTRPEVELENEPKSTVKLLEKPAPFSIPVQYHTSWFSLGLGSDLYWNRLKSRWSFTGFSSDTAEEAALSILRECSKVPLVYLSNDL